MSKGNMLLGHARGKVGSLVFSRNNGKQIVRAKADVVKNPQTETQMIQRIILNTVAQAYSRMSAITDHSFEGIPSGQKSMSYFMKKNMDILRNKIALGIADGQSYHDIFSFSPLQSNWFTPNEYLIAKGTLPEVTVAYQSGTRAKVAVITANTYEDVINALGLQRGDQLTFVGVQGMSSTNTSFVFCRVILDPTDVNGAALPLSTPFCGAGGAVNAPNPRNEGSFAELTIGENGLVFGFSLQLLMGAAVIVSRKKSDGSWLRSNADLGKGFEINHSFYPSMGECLDAIQNGGIDALSALYLNNAGQGRLASGQAVNYQVDIWNGSAVSGHANIIRLAYLVNQSSVNVLVGYDASNVAYNLRINNDASWAYGKYITANAGTWDGNGSSGVCATSEKATGVTAEANISDDLGRYLINNGYLTAYATSSLDIIEIS